MSQLLATILCSYGIIGLFVLDRDKSKARTSIGLWIPSIYLLIYCSRPVSWWLGVRPPEEAMRGNGIYSSPIDELVSLALLGLAVITLLARRKKVGLLLRGSGPIVLFYSYAALSALWSDVPYFTFKHWIKAVEDVMMVLVVWTDVDPWMAVKRILTRAGFVLIPLSLLFCKYYPDLGRTFNKSWQTDYNGVADTKNSLGVICMIFGLASLWCFLGIYGERKSRSRRLRLIAHGALLGIVIVLLMMSHSMTATVNLALCGTVMVVVSRRSSRASAARAHLAVAAALCCAAIPIFIAPGLVQALGRDTTFSGRTVIWHTLITFVRYPLFGAGYETFLSGPRLIQLKAIIDRTFQEAHNGYLEVWLNLGWIGVSLFAFLVISGYRNAIAAFRRDRALGSLRLAFFAAALIEGLTEAAFRMSAPLWFLLLWSMADTSMVDRPSPRREQQVRSLGAGKRSGGSALQESESTIESEIRTSVSMSSGFAETDQTESAALSKR